MVCTRSYRNYSDHAYKIQVVVEVDSYIYGAGLLVMLGLLKFYDAGLADSTGSRNWLRFGSFTIQPSELMKIAFIMMLALVVTHHNVRHRDRDLKTDGLLIAKMLAVTIPVLVLVMLQKTLERC